MKNFFISGVDDDFEAAVRETLHIEGHRLVLPLRMVYVEVLHHIFIYFVAMRSRFVNDKREPHCLPALALGHFGERLRRHAAHAWLDVLAHALLVIQSAVFAPYF